MSDDTRREVVDELRGCMRQGIVEVKVSLCDIHVLYAFATFMCCMHSCAVCIHVLYAFMCICMHVLYAFMCCMHMSCAVCIHVLYAFMCCMHLHMNPASATNNTHSYSASTPP
jgi:hypothetical protein